MDYYIFDDKGSKEGSISDSFSDYGSFVDNGHKTSLNDYKGD